MYVAKIGPEKFVIKRMPDTGLEHAHHCPSYLPPEALSGLGEVLGSAITEEADSGLTALKLGFRMSKTERAAPAGAGGGAVADSVAADPSKLTLRAVLHYLWQEADLATWHPGMAGKRNWRIVSWHLRQAARGKFTKGQPLATRLYIPEPFTAAKKTEIAARRLSAWAPLQPASGTAQPFMMLIGELKNIEPARFGHKLIIKHLPDAPLMIDDTLLDRLNRRFGNELELWQSDTEGHLMVITTFSVGLTGVAHVEELSVVMTDVNWLPYESLADKLLLDTALSHRRHFTKSLRYNLPPDKPMASLVHRHHPAHRSLPHQQRRRPRRGRRDLHPHQHSRLDLDHGPRHAHPPRALAWRGARRRRCYWRAPAGVSTRICSMCGRRVRTLSYPVPRE